MIQSAEAPLKIDLPPGGRLRLRVNGESMRPAFRRGDWLIVAGAQASELEPGDVVVVRRMHDLVTHRLVAITRSGWITKGDASRQADPAVPASAVLGRVTAVERDGKACSLDDIANRRRALRAAWASRCEGAVWLWVYRLSGRLFGEGSLAARALAAGASAPFKAALRIGLAGMRPWVEEGRAVDG